MIKKKLLINGALILGFSLLFTGCDDVQKDNISSNTLSTCPTRFNTTQDTYTINGENYKIIIDTMTDNVYLSCTAMGNRGIDTFPLFDKDGKPVKYSDLKKNIK